MGTCQVNENRIAKARILRKSYPLYHETKLNEEQITNYLSLKENEPEIWDHYLKFNKSKQELQKVNPTLYALFFDEKYKGETSFSINNLKNDDDELFYYFFNKRKYVTVNITNSTVVFPKFSLQYYPHFKDERALLTTITITSSKIMLDDQAAHYINVENCTYLDLSFNKIEQLPENFSKLKNLRYLSLRRNLLHCLPKTFEEFRLTELDLSENKFKKLPKEIFSRSDKLEKLNMNANYLESFEFVGLAEGSPLQFLFLAQNRLKKFPLDIKKFNKIKFVNLDENEIDEKDIDNLKEELSLDVEIKVNGGLVTLKKPQKTEGPSQPRNIESLKSQKAASEASKPNSSGIMSVHSSQNHFSKALRKKSSSSIVPPKKKNDCYSHLLIENPQTQIEKDINGKMRTLIKEKKKNGFDDKQIIEDMKEEKYFIIINVLEDLINAGREKELSLIEDFNLKILFKKCYTAYLTKKEFENTGILNPKYEEMEPFQKKYFLKHVFKGEEKIIEEEVKKKIEEKKESIEKSKANQREDISNLIFLRELNQLLSSSKIKMFLQYLGNIDLNIKKHIINLWETRDNNSFILILTEMKLFLREMLDYYTKNRRNGYDLTYEVEKSKSKNVIHDIFFNEVTLKILYNLGLSDKRPIVFKGIEQERFKFKISESMNVKHGQFENFLLRFINIFKVTKIDPLDLEV